MNDIIKEKLKLLPHSPGCYIMKNINDTVIYVGKSKNLFNRVNSYFTGSHNAKTTALVSEIDHFDYVTCDTDSESFILEINLIKQYNPRYNIMLKDDKSYPYILLTNEPNPRLIITRNIKKKDGKYFGPYPNVKAAKKTITLLNMIFPLRKCKTLPKKECLYYTMGKCLGPCIHKENINYKGIKQDITRLLNGDAKKIISQLEEKMFLASENLNFEEAIEYKNLIESINDTIEKQKIAINDFVSKDVLGFYYNEDQISFVCLYIRGGKIINLYSTVISYLDNLEEMITTLIMQFYDTNVLPKEILTLCDKLDKDFLEELLETPIIIPKKGKKKELATMAYQNAQKDLENKNIINTNLSLKNQDSLFELGELLGIDTPNHIEIFDNSNLFGEYPVSACCVFRSGMPSKSEYRKYHIKTVVGPDDFHSMQEVIRRRYLRVINDHLDIPDLIIMDGGITQVHAAFDVLRELDLDIPILGLKKDDSHNTNSLFFNENEFEISKNSNLFILLSFMQLTVHNFAISFFRDQKRKGLYSSYLDKIKGVGPKTREKLIMHFETIDNIKHASLEEFRSIGINQNLALLIINSLNEKD